MRIMVLVTLVIAIVGCGSLRRIPITNALDVSKVDLVHGYDEIVADASNNSCVYCGNECMSTDNYCSSCGSFIVNSRGPNGTFQLSPSGGEDNNRR